MKQLGVILFVLFIIKIQTFACDAIQIKDHLVQKIEQTYTAECKPNDINETKKSMHISCDNQKNYIISYGENTIYFLTKTILKFPFMSQCWIQGQISQNCQIQLESEKCQTWNMKD